MEQKKTIGKAWAEKLEATEAEAKRAAADIPRKEAKAIIERIEACVTEAEASGASSIELFGPLTQMDIAGVRPDGVRTLAVALISEKRPLRAEDLTGKARLVLEALEAYGLEGFLRETQGPRSDQAEHMFYIRPKRG